MGLELLLKAWLLEVAGKFDEIHNLRALYAVLTHKHEAPKLGINQVDILKKLDQFEKLGYPNPRRPFAIGKDDWTDINAMAIYFCRFMPQTIRSAME